jgi:glyoxylase-like metal-dependent hydrolase (beta-lactamase superfamily II)
MKIHAIQTGSVRIKQAQVRGKGRGLRRRLQVFTDPRWTGWLPTYAWMIEHREGVIVVDTGQGMHLLDSATSLHPYLRWEVEFRLEREQEIGPQLRTLGVAPRDVKQVVLTHLHIDHDGGLAHFPQSEILVARRELDIAHGWAGRLRGYMPHRWPSWFDPVAVDLDRDPFGPFAASRRLTATGDVIAVATPGHTAGHLSVMAIDDGITCVLAGDASYTEALMLAGQIDGVSADDAAASETLGALKRLAAERPIVYLPTHDPESAERLASRHVIEDVRPSAALGARTVAASV